MTEAAKNSRLILPETISFLIGELGQIASDDIAWSETITPPSNPEDFAVEAIWIICNSGMKATIARQIEGRVLAAIKSGRSIHEAFGHKGKAAAMETIWSERQRFFNEFNNATDKLSYLETMPWIGKITKYHLAKNYGVDCAKPDIHLQRLADRENTSVHEMCARLATETGYRIATIDVILWRACATGLINSRTGEICPKREMPTILNNQ